MVLRLPEVFTQLGLQLFVDIPLFLWECPGICFPHDTCIPLTATLE